MSGLDSRSVVFQSTYDTVMVRVADVDHDDDLDVVVSAVPSRDIVGIWLNDGRGRFRAADVRRFASSFSLFSSGTITDPSADPSTDGGLPSGRVVDGLPVLVGVNLARAPERFGSVRPNRLQLPLHSTATAPRAPPQRLA